jgi:hypothetical protein
LNIIRFARLVLVIGLSLLDLSCGGDKSTNRDPLPGTGVDTEGGIAWDNGGAAGVFIPGGAIAGSKLRITVEEITTDITLEMSEYSGAFATHAREMRFDGTEFTVVGFSQL